MASLGFKLQNVLCVTPWRWRSIAETCRQENCMYIL